ncbi:MAG: PAS domain S-box protein [Pirellulales bacterium]
MHSTGGKSQVLDRDGCLSQEGLILVVDADSQQRDDLGQLLQSAGYPIEFVSNAEAACASIDRQLPSLVLLEMQLPGNDSLDLLSELRTNPRTVGIPVVAVAGIDHPAVIDHCLASGCADFLVKPLSHQLLLRSVQSALQLAALKPDAHEVWGIPGGGISSHSSNGDILKEIDLAEFINSFTVFERGSRGFDTILDSAVDGLITTDQRGTIRRFNKAASGIFGYQASEVIGKNISMFVAGGDRERHDDYIATYLQSKKSTIVGVGREVEAVRKDGSRVPIYIAVSEAGDGQQVAFLAIVRDLTQSYEAKRRLEEAIQAAEAANRSKNEFLAHVSHELRTPLHGLLSYSRFGLEEATSATREALAEYFKDIQVCGETLLELVSQLLDLKDLEAGVNSLLYESVSLTDLLEEAIDECRSLAFNKQVTITNQSTPGLVQVDGDHQRLRLVIRNILANALRFSPCHGMIWVRLVVQDDAVVLVVRDEGPGIPEDELETIFEKFTQSSRTKDGSGGTGLGLVVCRQIILGHSGRVWAENHPQGGAIFHCQIPMRQPSREQAMASGSVNRLATITNSICGTE